MEVTETQQAAPAPEQPPKDLIGFLDFYLVKKAPFQLPDAWKEAIVQWGPWIMVVLLVLTLPLLLALLGLGAVFSPFGGVAAVSGFGIIAIGTIVQVGLSIASLPGLFNRKMAGWTMAFYARIAGLLTSLLSLNILGGLVSALIGLYILFQIRSKYTP